MKRKFSVINIFRLCLLACLGVVFAFPFYWMFINSVKPLNEIFVYPPELIPSSINFNSYVEAWNMQDFPRYLLNTIKLLFFNVVLSVGVSAVVAYGFSRFRFKGRDFIFSVVILTMIIPSEILIIPQYLQFNMLGWLNTHLPLIVPQAFGNAFYIFLIRQYLSGIPQDLDEAARLDGCNRMQVFLRVILPLIVPVLVTCALFQFMATWNDYMGPMLFLQTRDKWTMSLGLASLNSEQVYSSVNWGHRMAVSTIYSAIPLGVFLVCQKKLIGGIATTGIK